MNDQTHFRLFDLPGELVEDISFFFDADEAHKLLSVSPVFHCLFAKRVWWQLDPRVFCLSEPTRSMALARYGGMVQCIALEDEVYSAIKLNIDNGVSVYSILSVFSGVTTLWINFGHSFLMSNGIQFTDILMCFPNLYNLHCGVHGDSGLYDLVALADAINHRQNDCHVNPIECLNLEYFVGDVDNPWARLSRFVQMVSCGMKIRINPMLTTHILPSQSELQHLSRYLVKPPEIQIHEDSQYCYAALNRSLYWKTLDMPSSVSYPNLRGLNLQTCCMSSVIYDYADITPSNFPRIRTIKITENECENMISHSYPPAWERVLFQSWPYLNNLEISVKMTHEQLLALLNYHRRLTRLTIRLRPKMLDDNSTLNLATILPLLPNLRSLCIFGKNGTKVDYNPEYDDNEILARSHLIITQFINIGLSSRISMLLYTLPKLGSINVQVCQFYPTGISEVININNSNSDPIDVNMIDDDDDDDDDDNPYSELIATLNTISTKYSYSNPCIIKGLALRIGSDDYDWPLDVTLDMISLMPKLRTLRFAGETDEIPKAVKARFPRIKIIRPS